MIYGEVNYERHCLDITIRDYVFVPDKPTLRLSDRDAKELMEVLWSLGVRPYNDEMAATKLHLQDMRRLVFDGNNENQSNQGR